MTTAKNIRAISAYLPESEPKTVHPIEWRVFDFHDNNTRLVASGYYTNEKGDFTVEISTWNDGFIHINTYFDTREGCFERYNPWEVWADFEPASYYGNPNFQCIEFTAENIDKAIDVALDMYKNGVARFIFEGTQKEYWQKIQEVNKAYIKAHKGCRTYRL